ncbi:phospholipase A and acyltransferase 3-like [Haliotis cracherodii]|uniref:phospholipase A and acyltransferase 3-like n=1 Tax=Haliotis cracherodii TaxID=6455 RepID=UPI0039E97729
MLTQLDKFITARELLENGRLSLGDIVEIDRIIYSHWVLYIGEDDVVHVAGPDSDIPSSQASVIKCKLRDVAGSSLVRINNKLVPARERGFASLPCDVTVSRARGMVGSIVTHNLMTRNSEHFVTSWKYGVCWSDQAEAAYQGVFSSSPQTTAQEAHNTMFIGLKSLLHSAQHSDQRETTPTVLTPPIRPTDSSLSIWTGLNKLLHSPPSIQREATPDI